MTTSIPDKNAIEQAPIAGDVQMSWTIKALPHNTSIMDMGMIVLTLIGLIALLNGIYEICYLELPLRQRSTFLSAHFGIVCLFMTLYFWTLVIRQKYIYHYVVTDKEIDVKYKTHSPQICGNLFQMVIWDIHLHSFHIYYLQPISSMATSRPRWNFYRERYTSFKLEKPHKKFKIYLGSTKFSDYR